MAIGCGEQRGSQAENVRPNAKPEAEALKTLLGLSLPPSLPTHLSLWTPLLRVTFTGCFLNPFNYRKLTYLSAKQNNLWHTAVWQWILIFKKVEKYSYTIVFFQQLIEVLNLLKMPIQLWTVSFAESCFLSGSENGWTSKKRRAMKCGQEPLYRSPDLIPWITFASYYYCLEFATVTTAGV